MATVASLMRSPNTLSSTENDGQLPSFAAEADLFLDYGKGDGVSVNRASTSTGTSTSTSQSAAIIVKPGNNLSSEEPSSSRSATWQQQQQQQQQCLDQKYAGGGLEKSISDPASCSSPGTPMLTESTVSLQEILEADDVLLTPTDCDDHGHRQRHVHVHVHDHEPHQGSESQHQHQHQHQQDEWFNGDGDLETSNSPRNNRHRRPGTPPLSLYPTSLSGSKGQHPFVTPADDNDGVTSSTQAATAAGKGNDVTITVDGSSVGSSNASSAPRPGSIRRPILYSAIGSLENLNATSLGSLNKRLLSSKGKEFSRPGGGGGDHHNNKNMQPSAISTLIPPLTSGQANRIRSNNRKHNSNRSTTRRDKTNESASSSNKTTPPISNQDATKGASMESLENGKSVRNTSLSSSSSSTRRSSGDPNQASALRRKDRSTSNKSEKPSNLRRSSAAASKEKSNNKDKKLVSYNKEALQKRKKKPVEMFRPSSDAYTPRIEKKSIKYRAAELRTPVQKMASPMGTLQRPNFRDALRRVAMIMHQHIVKIERRFERSDIEDGDQGLFRTSMRDTFSESTYCTPTYKCTMIRIPMARPGMVYGLRKIKSKPAIPSEGEIYEFAHQLFKSVQLSSECSIVCLIYVERLMEIAKVPLLACTWRPIFMCGLLLASKVWQDLSSWNIEFASVYPQYSLDAINRLELNFLRNVKWDLYISSSLYAKYYFALRSLVEKVDFRQRYNRMVGRVDSVAQSEALKIQKRTEQVKEEALLQLSRSM